MSANDRPRALVLGVQLPGVDDGEHRSSLEELSRLGHTLGYDIIGQLSQRRGSLSKASVCGRGKLKELARWTGGSGFIPSAAKNAKRNIAAAEAAAAEAEEDEDEDLTDELETDEGLEDGDDGTGPRGEPATVVLVDHDLSPSQARNLEKATGAEILDRTSVILSIFQRHARSKEARLQVEIARLTYETPRLRESVNRGEGRQRGGGRGSGDTAHALDRRRVRDRIAELRREIAELETSADTRRHKRADQPTVALVGYTNAGKSSLMRRLTGSEVYVADKLFATLDTTVRALHPATKPRILASDTVGFIKKLPHDLVASFRSTLEEARDADLLLHVVDASDPAFPAQIEVTLSVLGELGALGSTRWLVLNKIDRVDEAGRAALAERYPEALTLSALAPEDIARLHGEIVAFFEQRLVELELFVPYKDGARVAMIHESCRVVSETHEDEGTRLVVKAPATMADKLRGG